MVAVRVSWQRADKTPRCNIKWSYYISSFQFPASGHGPQKKIWSLSYLSHPENIHSGSRRDPAGCHSWRQEVCGCNSQAATWEAPLSIWFLWGSNPGMFAVCKAGACLVEHTQQWFVFRRNWRKAHAEMIFKDFSFFFIIIFIAICFHLVEEY